MGHRKPTVTLDIYAHLFDARDHADKLAALVEANFANTLQPALGGEAIALNRCACISKPFPRGPLEQRGDRLPK